MRIVLTDDWFSEPMGYSTNFLPEAFARLGHDVHVVTSNGQVYCTTPEYRDVFERFLGPPFVAPGVKPVDGYTVHRLPSTVRKGELRITGLTRRLRELRPDVVLASHLAGPTFDVAVARPVGGYRLFVECHVHASVFPAATGNVSRRQRFQWWRYARTTGRVISSQTAKCYAISADAADIAVRLFGMHRTKVVIGPLGVDTNLFRPVSNDASGAAAALRSRLGFTDSDIVCIYTGRFSEGKGTMCLARAIGILAAAGERFKGLFVGHGSSADTAAIADQPGCVVHPFVMCRELPPFYHAADIGVWPKQESTSQIDAAACGLPLVLSRNVHVRERVDGNGLLYDVEGNAESLAATLRQLRDPQVRRRLGARSAEKMRTQFSWDRIAAERIRDFEACR